MDQPRGGERTNNDSGALGQGRRGRQILLDCTDGCLPRSQEPTSSPRLSRSHETLLIISSERQQLSHCTPNGLRPNCRTNRPRPAVSRRPPDYAFIRQVIGSPPGKSEFADKHWRVSESHCDCSSDGSRRHELLRLRGFQFGFADTLRNRAVTLRDTALAIADNAT